MVVIQSSYCSQRDLSERGVALHQITLYICDDCKPLRNCCHALAFVHHVHLGKGTTLHKVSQMLNLTVQNVQRFIDSRFCRSIHLLQLFLVVCIWSTDIKYWNSFWQFYQSLYYQRVKKKEVCSNIEMLFQRYE